MSEVLESWGNPENKLYAFILQIVIVYDDSELGLPRIFRWARHEAWLQEALIWWGWVGIKIYNLRKLIFKGPIFYLKPWKRPRMLLYLKKKKMTLEIARILTVLDTVGYLPSMHHFLLFLRFLILFQHVYLPYRAQCLRRELTPSLAPEVYLDLCKPVTVKCKSSASKPSVTWHYLWESY